MMTIAVSGSDGFVGRYVCSLLEREGYAIVKIDLAQGLDLCDRSIVEKICPVDCFIHLANLVHVPASYEDPEKYYRVNFLTTLNALEICRKFGARLVSSSSSYIYGSPEYLPVDEAHPVKPFNPYAQTKVIGEELCAGYHRDFGVKVSVLRPFNLYGIGQKGLALIPEIIGQLKEGKTTIRLKAAAPRRDYVYIEDVAKAFVACVHDVNDYGVYNVCSGTSFSVREITEIINRNLKHKVDFVFSESDRPNEVNETLGSWAKLGSIGWSPAVAFEDGIKRILVAEGL